MDSPPPPRTHYRWCRRLRTFLLTTLFILVLAALSILKFAADGLPRMAVDALEEALSTPSLRVELEDVRVSLRSAFIGSIALFPTHAITPAAICQRATLQYHWTFQNHTPTPKPTHLSLDSVNLLSTDFPTSPDSAAATPAAPPILAPLPVSCASLNAFGLPIQDLHFALSFTNHTLLLDQLLLHTAPNEVLSGSLAFTTSPTQSLTTTASLSGTLTPTRLSPLLRAFDLSDVPDIIDDFSFPSEPAQASVSFRFGPGKQSFLAALTLPNARYHNVPFLNASATLHVEGLEDGSWAGVHIRDLHVLRPEGQANASLFFDFKRHGLSIQKATSSIDFQHLAQIIGILSSIPWDTYETSGGNHAQASGFYAFSTASEPTSIQGSLSAGAFSFRRRVPIRSISSSFDIRDNSYHFPDIQGTAYNGQCKASVTLHDTLTNGLDIACSVDINHASTALISHDLFRRETSDDPGYADLSTSFSFHYPQQSLRSMTGNLSFKIRNSRLYQTPLFAGLTAFMARNVPGIDFLVNQDDLDAVATISDNAIRFSTLRVEGTLLSISAEGNYWFTNTLDLGVKVHLLRNQTLVGKILKVALYPVSKLFEMEVIGPIQEPSWTPTTLTLSSRSTLSDEQKYGPNPEPPTPAP